MWKLSIFKFINIHLPILYAFITYVRKTYELKDSQINDYEIVLSELGQHAADIF